MLLKVLCRYALILHVTMGYICCIGTVWRQEAICRASSNVDDSTRTRQPSEARGMRGAECIVG